jgi:hypothetical protein
MTAYDIDGYMYYKNGGVFSSDEIYYNVKNISLTHHKYSELYYNIDTYNILWKHMSKNEQEHHGKQIEAHTSSVYDYWQRIIDSFITKSNRDDYILAASNKSGNRWLQEWLDKPRIRTTREILYHSRAERRDEFKRA